MGVMFCPHCMREIPSWKTCPHCGKNPGAYQSLPHHLPIGSVLGHRYYMGRVLGEGGFGITYLGFDAKLERRVAIKEYFPRTMVQRNNTTTSEVTCYTEYQDSFRKGREQFLTEARTLAKVDSIPEIVRVLDYFPTNGTAYIVMEYLEGETLKSYVKSNGLIVPSTLFSMLEPLMRSLEAVHNAGLIHRDISPDNLMRQGDGKPMKLMDFGCARETDNDQTMTVMLKPGFAPAEQHSGHEQGPWSDVYSLCATMYFCMTGKVPTNALYRMQDDTLQPPSALGIQISPEQERALMKGLAVKKADRWQNVKELRKALFTSAPDDHTEVPEDGQVTSSESQKNRNLPKLIAGLVVLIGILVALIPGWMNKTQDPSQMAAVGDATDAPSSEALSNSDGSVYPSTPQQENLTRDVVYSVYKNLTQFDIIAETYSEALLSIERYLFTGMSDDSAMRSQLDVTFSMLEKVDVTGAAPSAALIERMADSPFSTADMQALHDILVSFKQDCYTSLEYLKQMASPDYYPTDAERKLEILSYYQLILEENLKYVSYGTNQLLLPVTNESALEQFWHENLPTLTYIPLRAVTWNTNFDALQSATNESFNVIEKAMTDLATIVGNSSVAYDAEEQALLQDILDIGYTEATAQRILNYLLEDPEQQLQDLVDKYLSQGLSQAEAEQKALEEFDLIELQGQTRIDSAPLLTDGIATLWEKMSILLSVELFEEAWECAQLYQQQMTNSDAYLPAMYAFIHLMKETDLDYGVMVMEYDPNNIHPVLKIGDIIIGVNGSPCYDTDSYISQKKALTSDSYTLGIIRARYTDETKTSVEWDMIDVEMTKGMPGVYLNTVVQQN